MLQIESMEHEIQSCPRMSLLKDKGVTNGHMTIFADHFANRVVNMYLHSLRVIVNCVYDTFFKFVGNYWLNTTDSEIDTLPA